MTQRKVKKKTLHHQTIWQQFTQSPKRYLWGLGMMTGIFLLLGLLLRFFWWTEPQTIPFIEGCQGPFRIRPASVKNKAPSHRIYGDLSLQTPEKSIESLLPPEEQPALPDEGSALPLLPSQPSPDPSKAFPKKPSSLSTSAPSKTISPAKKPLPSLDDLLQQMDTVVSTQKTSPPKKSSADKKRKGP